MGRAPCCDKMGVKRGPWTAEEDQILIDFIHRNGHGNWRALPKQAGLLRCGKSCRLRWTNYLRPDIKRGNFSLEEEESIINLHKLLGNRWSTIASRLPGRTDNEIKNVWNTHLKKRLVRMGIDPVTHAIATPSTPSANSHGLISPHNSDQYSDASLEASTSMKNDTFADNLALIPFPSQPKASPDSPTTVFDLSDSFYDSHDLSSEVFSSMSSIDSETAFSGDSGSRLDCINSFEVAIGYDQQSPTIKDETKRQDLLMDETFILKNQNFGDDESWFPRESQEAIEITKSEEMWPEQSSNLEVHDFMSAYPEDDFLSRIDVAETNPQLLWNMDFQANDDDTDYWLDVLRQAGSLPTLYQVAPLQQF